MRKLILLLFLSIKVFASDADTTLRTDLNFDGKEENIRLVYYPDAMGFLLTIGSSQVKESYSDTYDADMIILDINRNDGFREVVVRGFGSSDQTDCYFFQYDGEKIIPCGHLPSNSGFETNGKGQVTEFGWMGFYTIRLKYDFDSRRKTLSFEKEEFYDVNQSAEVKTPFGLKKTRDDASESSGTLSKGEKIVIVKTDIEPVCNKDENYIYDMNCDWFYIKSAGGVNGWIRGKDFFEKVDGLIWAG